MLKHLVVLALFGFCVAAYAQEDRDRSPFFVDDRITVILDGRADIEEGRLRLEYQFTNTSREAVELLLIRPDDMRWPLSLPPRGTQSLVIDQDLELASPTAATRAFRAQTYLTVYEEDAEARILVPAEVTRFAFDVSMPEGARILSSSVPKEILTGRVVADRKIRALPTVQVVLTTAPERMEIGFSGDGDGPLSIVLRNRGSEPASGMTLSAVVEIAEETPASVDGWRLAADDGVMRRWDYALPAMEGGSSLTLDLPDVAAGERRRLRHIAVHNAAGDLVAVD